KTHSAELRNDEELRVNAPLGSAAASPSTPIRVDTTVVGSRATAREAVTPSDLHGVCAGATHFVLRAEIGASLVTPGSGSKGDGGVTADCSAVRPRDEAPPRGGGDVVGLQVALAGDLGELAPSDQAPDGAVLPTGRSPPTWVVPAPGCARPPVDAPYLCSFGD